MNVVAHVAVCVNARLESFDDGRDDLAESVAIGWIEEDILAMIAAHRDVVRGAGSMQA